MLLTKPKARATCQECREKIVGSISLKAGEASEWAGEKLFIRAEGSLAQACVEHHRFKRGLGRLPQHDVFDVFDGSGKIGTMEVRSFTQDHHFETENEKVLSELLNETKRIHPERGA